MWLHYFHFYGDVLHRFSSGQGKNKVFALFKMNPPGSNLHIGLDFLFSSKDSEAVEERKQYLL